MSAKMSLVFSVLLLLFISQSQAKEISYNRSLYRHWVDADGDCQNTRAEVLIATSIETVTFKSRRRCVVETGFWVDPYSGAAVFNARHLDIDHIIPLKAAHDLGAQSWTKQQRQRFANDPDNLIPVIARLNRQKGAKGPWDWLPPNPSFTCDYISAWERLASKYKLKKSYTEGQWMAVAVALRKCSVQIRQPALDN